jgi:hypothetical protein
VALQGGAAGLIGMAAYVLTAWLLRSPELHEFIRGISRRLLKHSAPVEGAEEAQGV